MEQTFNFTSSSRWKLFRLLTKALLEKRISLEWEPDPVPETAMVHETEKVVAI